MVAEFCSRCGDTFEGCSDLQASSFFSDQLHITQVNEQPQCLAEDKHRILFVQRIRQQHDSAADTEVPEGRGNNTLLLFFALKPLHDESGGEQELPHQTEYYPPLFVRHEPHPFVQ